MGSCRQDCLLSVPESNSAKTDLDLISCLKAIRDAHMLRGALPGLVPAAMKRLDPVGNGNLSGIDR